MSLLRRMTGLGAAGSLAFAILAGGCVFAVAAGPRLPQAMELRAQQQTVGQQPPLAKTIVVSSSSGQIDSILGADPDSTTQDEDLTPASFNDIAAQAHRDFGGGVIPLAPQAATGWGITSGLFTVNATLPPGLNGVSPQLEVDSLSWAASQLRLVTGSMPGTPTQPVQSKTTVVYNIQVVITQQTAREFRLRPGSQLSFDAPIEFDFATLQPRATTVNLDVTGIVAPTDPGYLFWATDSLLSAPRLLSLAGGRYLTGAVIAEPAEAVAIEQAIGATGLRYQWYLPFNTTRLTGQPQAVLDQLNRVSNRVPPLTGSLANITPALSASTALLAPLASFVQTMTAVHVVFAVIDVGLAVAGAVVLLLAARMVAARRHAELAMLRARGASLWQLFARGTLGAAVACVPAAALGWIAAALLFPGDAPSGPAAWWPGLATLAVAVTAPGAVVAWQQRLQRRRRVRRRRERWRWVPRAVFEVTACAAAIGGIEVFHAQGGATGLYASAAPVLVAVPVVIVILRLYEVMVGRLARVSARQRGLTGFLGFSRAAAASVTHALPVLTLVLLLSMAAFTGMLRAAVLYGDTAVSWQETGADVVVAAAAPTGISPAAERAIDAVPGVRHAAAAFVLPVELADGSAVTAVVVDPSSYAALVASTQGFSPVRPALLAQPPGQAAIPVLASPQAASALRDPTNDLIAGQEGLPALQVRLAGALRSTPAAATEQSNGGFIVVPLAAIHDGSVPQVNLMLLTGPSIDVTKLRAVVHATMPGAAAPAVSARSQALAELTQAPVQRGTFQFITLSLAYAAALALAVLLLELALGARDREATLARLATMGMAEGQRVRLVAVELLPAIAAAAVAAAACALALPRLVGQEINLSVFTRYQASPPLRADAASVLLPLAGLLVVTAIALAREVRTGRGRGVAVTMRT